MTQSVQAKLAFPGDVPANLRCGFCRQPVERQFYRLANRFTCNDCAAQVNELVARNRIGPNHFLLAAAAGVVAALAGAAAWAAVVHTTHVNIGILAAFIGVAVGKAVLLGSGQRRTVPLQWLAVVLSTVGIAIGKVAIVSWEIVDLLRANGGQVTAQRVAALLQENARSIGQPFDLVWIGIAAYAAWRLCRPPQFAIAGPYDYRPPHDPANSSLQFDTVEPLLDIPPATPPGKP